MPTHEGTVSVRYVCFRSLLTPLYVLTCWFIIKVHTQCRYLPQCLCAISVQRQRVNGNRWWSAHSSAPQLSHNKQHSYKQTQVSTPSASEFVGRIDSCSSYAPNMCRISMRPQHKFPEQTFLWMGEQETGGMCFVRAARIKMFLSCKDLESHVKQSNAHSFQISPNTHNMLTRYVSSCCKYVTTIPCKMAMTYSVILNLA